MAAAPKIIVVGGGLAGLSAVIKIAEMGGSVDLFSIVPVKRSHSVCAQGGINAAKNLKGEGDSTWKHFDDTVYGGDFLGQSAADQRDVRGRARHHRSARSHGRALQPHARRPARLPPLRRHLIQPHRLRRRNHRPATALRPRRAGPPLGIRRQGQEIRVLGISLGRARRQPRLPRHLRQDLRSMEVRTFPADAVIIATGGNGAIFGKSTKSVVCTGSAQSRSISKAPSTPTASSFRCTPRAFPAKTSCA